MAAPKILVTNKILPVGEQKLREYGFDLVWSKTNLVADVKELIGDVDGIIARMTPVKQELIDAALNLKIIGMHGVGLDGIDVKLAEQKGIAVVHTPEANAISVAEYVMTMILNLTKKTIGADHSLRVENRFQDRDKYIGRDISGKTLAIVGLGRIGRRLACMAGLGFNMRVIAYDPYVSAEQMKTVANGVEKVDTVDELVAQADYLSFHTAMTPEMQGFVNYDLLKKMKPTAFFINEMRGALVVEKDLQRALEEGVIAGAALDVFSQEPTPKDFPLFTAPNLIATAHTGASTVESMERMILTLAEEFHHFFGGEKVNYLANPGYKVNAR